ncbi:MAG: hydroxymethylbilane synthase, partial [Xanthomonadales bacterium]|nr:hydroxymethylbilane synthase [Xanthomonadales bacterium]
LFRSSSLRRQCQLKALRPDLEVADLRGNVNTRIRKLQDGQYDAIILACAGLERLGMDGLITEELGPPRWLPAATQGTIGVQCRTDDNDVANLIAVLSDADAVLRTRAERAVATALQGSCQVPLAVFAEIREGGFRVSGMVGMPDGSELLRAESHGVPERASELAAAVAEDLIGQGADRIIAALGQ